MQNGEHVLFAVFADTHRDGDALISKSFTKNLNNTTQSLARESYITRRIFNKAIVGTRVVHGVAIAHVDQIRQLQAELRVNNQPNNVRAMCVTDLVERNDCEGHATMGFSEQVGGVGVSEKELGKVRQRIKLDLVDIFSKIAPVETVSWRNGIQVGVSRIACIALVARTIVIARIASLTRF